MGAVLFTACESESNRLIKVIATDQAPKAIGPYSQAILVDGTLYLAGQIALDPSSGKLVEGGIEVQTRRVMQNLNAVLDAAGYQFDDVVQTQVFLSNLNHYKAMNSVYATYFNERPPARAVVEAARIPRDALVEIMMVAQRP
ncbi:MAG: RidA family protein [Candidatus Marinimicrobia bacterium]|nr:RidA family protein [Candidatus Neomarinimicrobiota bacterium]MBT4064691.1 RidA family protein [Candidatus Neomarinimicrobiota bacterium]MBT4307925.1 RidA family protein [Candidatus Neomarinimicrobiota bacterium]MBT4453123.1 RidA family protein [Candidatus Neomarinimicrobiota bacterium]MBT4737530.1 RidA family protein [Candidatus Neomarinimicrobiota bacterium]